MSNCLPEYKGKRYNSLDEIGKDIDHAELSELYHQSKSRKINPSLIDTVEDVLYSKPEDAKVSKAVIKINGKTYEGNNHAEAILKAKEAGEDISKVDRKADGKFKLSNGEIIDRAEAKARFGKDQSELLIPQNEAADQANKDYANSGIKKLEEQRDAEIEKLVKPDFKLDLVKSADLVNSSDPIGNKEKHNEFKERYKKLKQLIDCL